MPLTGDEIRRRLAEFAARWGGFRGSEREGAQTFLNELLTCYGVDAFTVGARFEQLTPGGFMDMFWPGVCIFEMKRPSEAARLEAHREQALRYWQTSGTPRSPAPRFVVLCAFHRFEVWEPGAVYTEPRAIFDLTELPHRLDALLFLAGGQPVFAGQQADVTREAVGQVTDLLWRLQDRRAAEPSVLNHFILQCIWSLFAEDLQMLPTQLFTRVVDALIADPSRSSADDLGQLFRYLAQPEPRPSQGMYAGTPYADGGLFEQPASVHLEPEELDMLRHACEFDWKRVEPGIFGSLLEGALGRERQWRTGAHYTAEADILKVVLPTIVDPWRERIAACRTVAEVEEAQHDLMNYVVLDPTCGSGNFLYVAYRELRRIESELRRRAADMRRSQGLREQQALALFFPLTNIRGIEIDPFAVQLARVTLWMGHKLAVEELDIAETVLPLADLSGIRWGDALRVPWPRADAIVGNPPYHGSQQIRRELGDEYAEWLRSQFGVGLKDYAVYFFRRTHEQLPPGGRAGLVGTNSVSQGRARSASLDWIVDNGGVITNAVSKQPWPGAAVVNVSIVNWTKADAPGPAVLDGVEVEGITSALLPRELDVSSAVRLPANRGRAFQGAKTVGAGFLLDPAEAADLLARSEAPYRDVVRPFLIGQDIATDPQQQPARYVIDFGRRTLEEAMEYPAALDLLRARVKPERAANNDRYTREHWWRHGRPVLGLRDAIAALPRYIAGMRVGKRILFAWCDPWTCPSDAVNAIALADDYSMGILSSSIHHEWARAHSSTLRLDFRYTPTSAFETFPWPRPSPEQRQTIGALAGQVVERRQEICLEREIGLTRLYNEVDEGAYADLGTLHASLDRAVASAYGWSASAAADPEKSNQLLLELNRQIAAGEVVYDPF